MEGISFKRGQCEKNYNLRFSPFSICNNSMLRGHNFQPLIFFVLFKFRIVCRKAYFYSLWFANKQFYKCIFLQNCLPFIIGVTNLKSSYILGQ